MTKYPEILIYNLSSQKMPVKFFKETIQRIFSIFKKKYPAISLIILPEKEMKALNYYWRHKNKSTTILTFKEGDIFLCPSVIIKQAKKRKISLEAFYKLLLVHGVLHLFGYTHDKLKDAKKMELLESKILQSLV
ncbi:MAG: rRNA maturation RNase YbeY [Parcubacteria group bacterium]|nr:rRNA maturation RNase YbeY [Parcubacteria group bacterium]